MLKIFFKKIITTTNRLVARTTPLSPILLPLLSAVETQAIILVLSSSQGPSLYSHPHHPPPILVQKQTPHPPPPFPIFLCPSPYTYNFSAPPNFLPPPPPQYSDPTQLPSTPHTHTQSIHLAQQTPQLISARYPPPLSRAEWCCQQTAPFSANNSLFSCRLYSTLLDILYLSLSLLTVTLVYSPLLLPLLIPPKNGVSTKEKEGR